MSDYDAVVVGGSLAGCTAAALLARQGARVALLERAKDADHYKVCCTHYVQAGAVPVLERLGVDVPAVRSVGSFHTRYGWVRPQANGSPIPEAFDARRRDLDPAVRRIAIATDGVDYRAGTAATGLLRDAAGRPSGVATPHGEVRARVVVAADGRGSGVARMAGVRGRVRPNARFAYYAYFAGLPEEQRRVRMWFEDPDVAYTFPAADGQVLIAAMPHKDRLPEFKADVDRAMADFFSRLDDAPDLGAAERVGKWIGRMDMTNVRRPAAVPGLAFVGDAAQASDPLWGVGCGFALMSGAMLADALGPALASGGDVDAALERYRRDHRRALAGHHFLMCDYATGRGLLPFEKLLYRGAVRDARVARALNRLGSRREPVHKSLTAGVVARAVVANLRSTGSSARMTANAPGDG
jgi:menaquinone-9 beta-reductase